MKANGVVAMHIYLHEFMNIWSDLISRSLLALFLVAAKYYLEYSVVLNNSFYYTYYHYIDR